MAYWQPIRGIQDPVSIRSFNGVIIPEDEGFNLPDNAFTELENFCPDAYPFLKTRPGYSVIGSAGSRVLGMAVFKGTELHTWHDDGTWQRLNIDGTWTVLKHGLSKTSEWSTCHFQGNLGAINLIASNGIDPIMRYDGTTVTNLANAPAGGNYIEAYANRLYCSVGSTLKFSALRKGDDWTTAKDAGEIVIETNNGENINGLRAGNGHLSIFKQSSIHELYGTGPANYKVDEVAQDIGQASYKSNIIHDDVVAFIGREFLYLYGGGIRPSKDFSGAVMPMVRNTTKYALDRAVGGSDGTRMYFGLPVNSATDNNMILQYDPQVRAWYPWKNIGVTHMVRIGSTLYMGDAQGRVLKIGGAKDNDNPITWKAVTKAFTAGSMARRQNWYKVWIVVDLPTGSTMDVWVSGSSSGNDWKLVKSIKAKTGIQKLPVNIPVNMIANSNFVRIKIEGTGEMTLYEITRQVREMPLVMR